MIERLCEEELVDVNTNLECGKCYKNVSVQRIHRLHCDCVIDVTQEKRKAPNYKLIIDGIYLH